MAAEIEMNPLLPILPKIENDELVIRKMTISDSAFILELVNSEGWLTNIGDRKVHSIEQAAEFIQKVLSDSSKDYYTVVLKQGDTPIGIVSLIQREAYPCPDLGVALLPSFGSRSLAFAACQLILDHLKSSTDLKEIIAVSIDTNKSAHQLLNRLQFVLKNELKAEDDVLVFCKKLN